jgi:hypothetical protein
MANGQVCIDVLFDDQADGAPQVPNLVEASVLVYGVKEIES